jgi:spore coat protein U-like protein
MNIAKLVIGQRVAVLLIVGLIPWAQLHAQTQQVSTTFEVQARVEAGCEVTTSDLNPGTYSVWGGAPRQVPALMRATCTPDTTYHVGLIKGTSRSAILANTTGRDTEIGVGTGLTVDHTLFGRFPATQVVRAGDYADAVTVRVYY